MRVLKNIFLFLVSPLKYTCFIILFHSVSLVKSQCTISGGMSVFTACNNGQGCSAGCDLTAYNQYGPQCNGTANTGNCFGATSSNGHQAVYTSYQIPAGCTATVTADFMPRTGCSASGVDANDSLVLGGSGGTALDPNPTMGAGSSNAAVSLSYRQTGGTVYIRGKANRSEEIITFTLALSNTGACVCTSVLPIELVSFWGEPTEKSIELKWIVNMELNLDYYKLQKSIDGINFTDLGKIMPYYESAGKQKQYSFSDPIPVNGANYYRLANVDMDGTMGAYKTIVTEYNYRTRLFYTDQDDSFLNIHISDNLANCTFQLLDITGRIVKEITPDNIHENLIQLEKSGLARGAYILRIPSGIKFLDSKIIIY